MLVLLIFSDFCTHEKNEKKRIFYNCLLAYGGISNYGNYWSKLLG